MRSKTIGSALDLATSATGTAVDLLGDATPFLPGYTVALVVKTVSQANSTLHVEMSDDDVTYTDALTAVTASGQSVTEIVLKRYIRTRVVAAGSPAGTAQVTLLGIG
jgi:hypothetical protein